jgi:hypothetical protein
MGDLATIALHSDSGAEDSPIGRHIESWRHDPVEKEVLRVGVLGSLAVKELEAVAPAKRGHWLPRRGRSVPSEIVRPPLFAPKQVTVEAFRPQTVDEGAYYDNAKFSMSGREYILTDKTLRPKITFTMPPPFAVTQGRALAEHERFWGKAVFSEFSETYGKARFLDDSPASLTTEDQPDRLSHSLPPVGDAIRVSIIKELDQMAMVAFQEGPSGGLGAELLYRPTPGLLAEMSLDSRWFASLEDDRLAAFREATVYRRQWIAKYGDPYRKAIFEHLGVDLVGYTSRIEREISKFAGDVMTLDGLARLGEWL